MDNTSISAQKINVSSYIQALDGVRGVCCFFVILIHFKFSTFNLPSSIGYAALHCFFIMSAFLITKNLFKDKERSNNFAECFKVFYIKRTARIFPVYYLYLFLVILIFILIKLFFHANLLGVIPETKRYGWMLLTFFYNFKMQVALHNGYKDYLGCFLFPHLWSMALEEQFYIVIIFLVWFCNKRTLRIISILFIILIPIIRIVGYLHIGHQTNDDFLRTLVLLHSPQYQFDAFFYGIAIAIIDIKKSKWLLYLFVVTFILIIGFNFINAYLCSQQDHISIFTALRNDKYIYRNFGYVFLDSTVNIFCCAWVLCVIYYPEKFKIFNNKFLVRFGELTYCLYIFQFVSLGVGTLTVILLYKFVHIPLFIAELIGFIFYLSFNVLISDFVSKKIELPVLIYKDKLLREMKEKKEKNNLN